MIAEPRLDENAPWKARFRAPIVAWTALAAENPERGLLCTNQSGVFQLYAWHVRTGALTQLTDRPEGKAMGFLSPDGEYAYYFEDTLGNEVGHYVRVPFHGGPPQDITADMATYSSWSLGFDRAGSVLGFTAAMEGAFHLFVIPLGSGGELGERREIYQSAHLSFGPWFSYEGEIAVLNTTEKTGKPEYSLVAIEVSSGTKLAELWDGPNTSVEAVSFSPRAGDDRLLASTNRSGVKRPLIWNPRTGERTDLDLAELDGEVLPVDWSPDARRLLLCQFANAVQQLYTYDLERGTLTRLRHPAGTLLYMDAPYFTSEGEIFADWQDATHPRQVIALDGETGEMKRTVFAAGAVPPGRPWRSITFTSADGQEIQGWLAVPEGDGPFPAILHTHGGPEAVTTEMFLPAGQLWVDHGFAFLTINYRGSVTFGSSFQRQIWGNPGFLEVDDMAAARQWLIDQGIARPDQILLTGWSYGGYLTLQGLGTRPELWAGGMAGVAIADWTTQYEDSAETIKAYQRALLGGTPEERPEQYAASSPITYVERVQAPVLVVQGRNDARCPARPVELYEEKMQALGKPIEVLWFETGHGGSSLDVEKAIEHHARMLEFACRVVREGAPAP